MDKDKLVPIVQRRGGWFVADEANGWSGPWLTEDAAKLARANDFDGANRLHTAALRSHARAQPLEPKD